MLGDYFGGAPGRPRLLEVLLYPLFAVLLVSLLRELAHVLADDGVD